MLICLLFCVSDETVRYVATLCLAKTHSRDKELRERITVIVQENPGFWKISVTAVAKMQIVRLRGEKGS